MEERNVELVCEPQCNQMVPYSLVVFNYIKTCYMYKTLFKEYYITVLKSVLTF